MLEGDHHHHRLPEAVQNIRWRHVRSHYVSSQLIRFSSRATDAHGSRALPASTGSTLPSLDSLLSSVYSQAKYWNPCVNEVEGVITDSKGNVIHKLFGKWHEAVYCGEPPSATCVWRASTTSCFLKNMSINPMYGVLMEGGGGSSFLSVCVMQM